jgi:hypothetical protein
MRFHIPGNDVKFLGGLIIISLVCSTILPEVSSWPLDGSGPRGLSALAAGRSSHVLSTRVDESFTRLLSLLRVAPALAKQLPLSPLGT